GIADVRLGQRADLPAIGRGGENLLIARHGGVEHHLARRVAVGADGSTVKYRAVLERQYSGCRHSMAPVVSRFRHACGRRDWLSGRSRSKEFHRVLREGSLRERFRQVYGKDRKSVV